MVGREQIRRQLMQTFLAELRDHARNLGRLLSELEKQNDSSRQIEITREMFRAAHSLKGDARVVGLPLLESVCHEVESRLAPPASGGDLAAALDRQLLRDFVDALEEAAERLVANQDLTTSRLARLAGRLLGDAGPKPMVVAPVSGLPESSASATPPLPHDPAPLATSVRLPAVRLDAMMLGVSELGGLQLRPQARREQLETIRELVRLLRDDLDERRAPRGRDLGIPVAEGAATNPLRSGLLAIEQRLEELYQLQVADELATSKALSRLEDEVRRARLVPFGEALAGFDRLVRELADQLGKSAELHTQGEELELDRHIVQQLREPLLHLLRNAVDHGLETIAERNRLGKPDEGNIRCSARLQGDRVVVEVVDDGQGIDWEALRLHGQQRGIPNVDELDRVQLLFRGGVTTAKAITSVSGRGIGLDVVRSRIAALRGEVDVQSVRNAGTTFTILIPVEVSRRRVLLVRSAGQVMALDHSQVVHVARLHEDQRRQSGGRAGFAWRDQVLPLWDLAELVVMPGQEELAPAQVPPVLVVRTGGRHVALVADALEGAIDTTVQALGGRLVGLKYVQGTLVLPDGSLVLLLDTAQLLDDAGPPAVGRPRSVPHKAPQKLRLIVADDSLTTRTLEKTILEAAGFDVLTAVDGKQAWQLLQQHGADLLITDVEMPSLDGFQLTEAVRGSKRFRSLPVILLTARHSPQDQHRGLEAGADAYLIKSAFDQRQLIATIEQLL